MNDLTPLEEKLLSSLSKNSDYIISKTDLKPLLELHSKGLVNISNDGTVTVNISGDYTLDNIKIAKKKERNKFIIRSIIIPAIVSLITSVSAAIATSFLTSWLAMQLL
ncbi:MAG: hypothetical protein IKK99_01110 [Oscillospiraceae bacterium]|nr:hypothetical protein [Oscillospiraceae bacterium]